LIDDNPGDGTAAPIIFFFSAADDPLTPGDEHAAGLLASNLLGGPEADPSLNPTGTSEGSLDAQWGFVHGEICVADSDGAFLHFGKCDGSEPVSGKTINQNLGQDRAAFALFNQLLSDEILDPSSPYTLLIADIRFSRIDNGYEQLFSQPTNFLAFEQIPEPGTLTLFGLGLAGLGIVRFRKMRQR
jgi:hypothetical protein